MRLSISNIAWDCKNDLYVYDLMYKYGFTGLEIAPTRIIQEQPYEKIDEAKSLLPQRNDIEISSIQSIWYGRKERIFGSWEEREKLREYTHQAINFASELLCNNVVFGCPVNRTIMPGENLDIAVPFFQELANFADSRNTVIGIEANPTIYNTNYINDTQTALKLIRQINSKGFRLNYDLGTVIQNKEDISIIEGNVEYINHVHISEPYLDKIVERKVHGKIKNILQNEHYDRFISIEMKKQDSIMEIEEVMQYIRRIFGDDL